jgi:hypothetical protein
MFTALGRRNDVGRAAMGFENVKQGVLRDNRQVFDFDRLGVTSQQDLLKAFRSC